ncbi:hypothetical protein [Chlamydia felis Fe/C-56]|uniref:Uncharacterized protein n=1 Tax=Chlamydia felis (strain Fe/C-56) TaxID=264202 RepID=Q254Q4_CHLFF|nr:hypothetical protein [Chlamydia felis]BAE81234.1 hypothetical protein [Chlamydia felis Fe/C-56]
MRKRHSFFHPTPSKPEPLVSMIQKTITMVERIQGRTGDPVNLELNKICADIQEIKMILVKQAKDIDCLYTKNTDEQIQNLETDMSFVKTSLHNLLEELKGLKIVVEEGIDNSLNDHSHLVRSVLVEIYQKFLSTSGGTISGNIDMNNHAVLGLEMPQNPTDSYAASVGYVESQLRPIEAKLVEICEKVKSHDSVITSMNFQMMPVSGGKFRGIVDMDGHRLTGIAYPRERSDAISLDYLHSYLESKNLSEGSVTESVLQCPTANVEACSLYSIGVSHKVDCPLPIALLSQGMIGFTWRAKSPTSSGKFPMNALKYALSDQDQRCFVLNNNILYGKYAGSYTWDLTLKALIPSILEQKSPKIRMRVYYDQSFWNHKEELRGNAGYIEMPLISVGRTSLGGHSYDIVELPAGNARVLVVPENCGGVTIHLENDQEGLPPQDLYIVQAAYSCSWRRY